MADLSLAYGTKLNCKNATAWIPLIFADITSETKVSFVLSATEVNQRFRNLISRLRYVAAHVLIYTVVTWASAKELYNIMYSFLF